MSRAIAELDLPVGSYVPPTEAAAMERADAQPKAKRWLGLDLYRFVAVLLMVQGHVFSFLLDSATKSQGWYPHHSFVHGYTAPMFLFGAGLAFGYTTFRKWDAHASGGPAAWKRYRRYGWLLVIGYGLHLPTLSIARLLEIDDPSRIAQILQVDVLQHIGMSLAICQLLVFLVKRQRVFVSIVAALGAAAVFGAPWIWNLDLSATSIPVGLAAYVNDSTGSLFPLTPWMGFTYLGIVVAYVVGVSGPAQGVSERVAWPFFVLSLAFMIVPIAIDRLGFFPWPHHNFWKTNPLFFFWRVGNILFVLATLCFAERWMSRIGWLDDEPSSRIGKLIQRAMPWVKIAAAETLVIYVAHVLILYGSGIGPSLRATGLISPRSHDLLEVSIVAGLLILGMILFARVWFELRKNDRRYFWFRYTLLAALLLYANLWQ